MADNKEEQDRKDYQDYIDYQKYLSSQKPNDEETSTLDKVLKTTALPREAAKATLLDLLGKNKPGDFERRIDPRKPEQGGLLKAVEAPNVGEGFLKYHPMTVAPRLAALLAEKVSGYPLSQKVEEKLGSISLRDAADFGIDTGLDMATSEGIGTIARPVIRGAKALSGITKGMGRLFSGLSTPEAEEFVKSAPEIYEMAKKIESPVGMSDVQKQASDLLGPAIKSLGKNKIEPLMSAVDAAVSGKKIPVESGDILGLIGHGDNELDSLANKILRKNNPYGEIGSAKTIMADAEDINALKRKADELNTWKKTRSDAQMPSAKDKDLSYGAGKARAALNEGVPEITPLNEKIGSLIELRDNANTMAGKPLNPFSTESGDQMAVLGNLSTEAGAPELLSFRNKYKAAKSIIGRDAAKNMSAGQIQHSLWGDLSRMTGRGLLRAEDAISTPVKAGADMLGKIPGLKEISSTPPSVWESILQALKQKEQ